jgi:hypothetical protein
VRRAIFLLLAGVMGGTFLNSGLRAADASAVKVLRHAPGMAFASFTDPRESAFTVDVPRGWKTSGGLFRFASVDTRAALELIAPEGDIRVTSGDPEIPPFTLPNPTLAWSGFREGSWYSPGYGVRMMVRTYQPGTVFAEDYVRSRVARQIGCNNLAITARRERVDLTGAINALYAQFGGLGVQVREAAGDVEFACTRDGQPWRGYYLASTLLAAGQGGGVWHAERLIGFAAAAAKAGIAQMVMLRMVRTARVNPEWERMQEGVTMSTSQIVARTNELISSTIRETFRNQWHAHDEAMRRDANARRGAVDLRDTETGETWTVESGRRHFWRKPGSDTIVGTDTYDPPGIGYEPLHEY